MKTNIANVLDKLDIKDKKKFYIIVCAIGIFLILDFSFLLFPQLKIIGKLNPEIKTLRRDIFSVKKDMASFDVLFKRYEDTKEKAQLYSKQIIREDQISALLEEISLIAKNQDIKIMQIKAMRDHAAKPVATIGQDKYYLLPISLDIKAGYHSLGSFFYNIETKEIFMRVTGYDISPNPNNYLQHQMKLTIETYLVASEFQ